MYAKVKELNKKTTFRLAICSLAAVGVVTFMFFITMVRPNYPQYCAKCHDTVTFHNSCKKLSGDIACIDCHTHENRGTRVMAVEMRNEHCVAEPCHPSHTLSAKTSIYKNIKPFQHKTHMYEITKNFKLKCTSCHGNLNKEKHFEIDERTCNTCHFINTQKPMYTQDEKLNSDCTLCHGHIEKTKEIYGKTFQHDVYEKNEKVHCSDCHFQTIQGNGEVDKRNCLQCHSNITDISQSASDLHDIHIDKHKTACTSCHASIKHGLAQTRNTMYEGNNPGSIHENTQVQNLIMMGQGGKGVKGEPDPMYLATLNCSACHKDKQASTSAAPEVCNNCHKKGFDKILSEQMHFITSGMRLLKTLLVKAKRQHNVMDPIIQEAEVNYNLIRKDGSLGAHNIKYMKDLLNYSIKNVKQVTGQGASYPGRQEIISQSPLKEYQFPTNSCIDRCHVDYTAYRTSYEGKIFQHKTHSPGQGLECKQCHNNDPVNMETHGRLIIQDKDCEVCHHKRTDKVLVYHLFSEDNKNLGKTLISRNYPSLKGDLGVPVLERESLGCVKCHTDVRDYMNGNFKNIISKIPDWMSNAVSCTDCHKLELNGYSFKAVREYCVECHNPDYGLLYDAWRETLNSKAKQFCKNDIKRNIQDLLKLIQSYGMHNFRLSETLLKSIEQ